MSFDWLVLLVPLVLEVLVLFYLTRGYLKRFPALFVYCLTVFLASIVLTILASAIGQHTKLYFAAYWSVDLAEHLLILLVISSLIRQSLATSDNRDGVVQLLAGAIFLATAGSLLYFRDEHVNRWMTSVSRNLSFLEEILNFVLWSVLLRRREFDVLLLLVSAGLGLQVTGEVIGHTLRMYSSDVTIPNILVTVSEVLCLAIWAWAFRMRPGITSFPVTPTRAVQQ